MLGAGLGVWDIGVGAGDGVVGSGGVAVAIICG